MSLGVVVAGFFIFGVNLAVEAAAFTFHAFELQQDMADSEVLKHVFDLFPEGFECAQLLVMHPDVG